MDDEGNQWELLTRTFPLSVDAARFFSSEQRTMLSFFQFGFMLVRYSYFEGKNGLIESSGAALCKRQIFSRISHRHSVFIPLLASIVHSLLDLGKPARLADRWISVIDSLIRYRRYRGTLSIGISHFMVPLKYRW